MNKSKMSESPMKLRNRGTPSKTQDTSYEACVKTPIGNRRSGGDSGNILTPSRTTRKSVRLQFDEKNSSAIDADGGESTCSNGTFNSNAENENILRATRENNENTPGGSRSKLSRNRSGKLLERRTSYVAESSYNEESKSVKCTIRRQVVTGSRSTPNGTQRSLRERVLQRRSSYVVDSSSEDEDDESPSKSTRRVRNASYFSKQDFEAYVPPNGKVDEEELQTSSEEDEGQGETSSEDETNDSESDDEVQVTPNKRLLLQQDLTKLALTPEILNRLEGRSVRRRLGVNSPVATGSQTMSPNPENYFLAENRIKYKSVSKQPEVMNDAMKGKRRKKRKLFEGADSRLPDKISSDFSVTTEALKATVGPEQYISGNIHEDKVEQLFRNVIEHEFPYWIGLFRDGFNVMLYGYGSKLPIFKEFEEFVNDQYLTITINGMFPKLVPRKLLYGIYEYVNPEDQIPRGTNLEAVAKEAIKSLKAVNHPDVFIIVNNFDNMALRFPQMLTVLCWLAQVPYIHVLASCDTVNSFLGVTQSQSLLLNFCWMHCPTYEAYREEVKWIPGVYGNESKGVTQKSSLNYVLQSLTGNARKAFALLAQMQLKQMKSRAVQKSKEAYTGVRFQELAKECREKFIAHSDENLRTLLVEFFDHKLIKQTGKGKHLENTLLVELDLETLEEIISELS